jgi:uncharacterized protein YutE (UPF0331/DUF86 family)
MNNLLIHGYWKIDNQLMFYHIRNRLSDIKEFVIAIEETIAHLNHES